jgi:hypothetical protein
MKRPTRLERRQAIGLSLLGLIWSSTSLGADLTNLTTDCEVAIARSAAPLRLRADASVFALQGDQYKKVIAGDGPLTCIVERNHKASVVPQCMDRAGLNSTLPAIVSRSLLAVSGASFEAINADNAKKTENGEFNPASRPGVSYMMSDYNYTFVGSAGRVLKIPPHVMFYAPYVSNADIGGSFRGMTENIGTPFVFNEGIHGYFIVYTHHQADPNEVADKCRGQLGEAPPSFDPFPKG